MSIDRQLRTAEILLEQIAEEPEAILRLLQPAERDAVMAELRRLEVQAESVASEESILDVSMGVHELVSMSPSLRRTLLPSIDIDSPQRQITVMAHQATAERREHVQRQAAQIRNRMLECRKKLEEALREAEDAEENRER